MRNLLKVLVLGVAVMGLAVCQQTSPETKEIKFQKYWPEPASEARFIYRRTLISDLDVTEETSAERFKRMATGGKRVGRGFGKPHGMVVRNQKLYVADSTQGQIHVFDLANKKASAIGVEGTGSLRSPLGIDIDNNGNLYVMDSKLKRVMIYGPDGKFLRDIQDVEKMDRPSGVAVSPSGDRIYAIDTGGVSSSNHKVSVFDASGAHLFDIGSRGTEPGKFNLPLAATVTPDGNVHVVDGGNFRIQSFTADGDFISTFGIIGQRPGNFARPKSISSDAEGNLYVSDAAFGNIQIFQPGGQLLMWLGGRGAGGYPGQYMLTVGVAVDKADGTLYVGDQYFRKVDVFEVNPDAPPARTVQEVEKELKVRAAKEDADIDEDEEKK